MTVLDIPSMSACTVALFDLSAMVNTYTEEQCKAWLIEANEMAQLLSQAVRKRFQNLDAKVQAANKKINAVQVQLETELANQQNTVATVNAVADLITVVEKLVAAGAGLRLPVG